MAALTEELLRNDLLNAENGLNKLRLEQNSNKTIFSNVLDLFRSQVWLLPTAILFAIMLGLLAFRLYLGYFALRAKLIFYKIPHKKEAKNLETKRIDTIATAMYYYLMLLHSQSFQQGFGPVFGQQLSALSVWKQRLEELRLQTPEQTQKLIEFDSETNRFLACLDLLQKYFFAPQFSVHDLAALRRELRQIKSHNSWNPIFITKIFSLFFFTRKNARLWHRHLHLGSA